MNFIEKWLGVPESKAYEDPAIMEKAISGFISQQVPENMTLEYKESRSLGDIKDIRKAICAFANSEGGLLMVGVSEDAKTHLPVGLDWITDPKWSKEKFQDTTINLIEPYIQGVRIVGVTKGSDKIFLVDVPASLSPPHMCDYTYYFRNNFESLHMEHSQVADFFGKRRRPIIIPVVKIHNTNFFSKEVLVDFQLKNEGLALGKWPLFRLNLFQCAKFERLSSISSSIMVSPDPQKKEYTAVYIVSLSDDAVHSKINKGVGTAKIILQSEYATAQIVVGAEEAPTDQYLALFNLYWIDEQQTLAKGKMFKLPLFKIELNSGLDSLVPWLKGEYPDFILTEKEHIVIQEIKKMLGIIGITISDEEIFDLLQKERGITK